MANIDYAGLLTGISGQNQRPSPFTSPSRDQQLLGFAAKQNEALTGRLGGMFGQQQQDPVELAKTKLVGLDPTNPADQTQFIQLLNIVDPAKAAQFKQQLEAKATSLTKSTNDAKTVADALPTQYASLAVAVRNKVPGAINAALGILGKIPDAPKIEQASLVNTKTNTTVGGVELKDGIPYKPGTNIRLTPQELEGMAISKTYVKPPAPLVSTVQTPQQKVEEKNLERQASYVDITAPVAATAVTDKKAANAILTEVGKGFDTGGIADFVANQSKNLQGVFQLAGVAYPESFSKKIGDQAVLKILQNEAIIPMMEAQGRGFTDKDLEYQQKVLPGYTQPWQYNEAAATIKLNKAVNQIEENTFANQRSNLSEVTSLDHTTLWDDYLTKIPRSKIAAAKRNGVDYKRMEVIQDGANLSQYWVKDKPRGFTLSIKGENKDVTWADIKDTAAANNMNVREFLAAYENQGLIVKGVY
jgi:hypothetical protein